MAFKILLAEKLDGVADARLNAAADVVHPATPDEAGLCAAIGDCDALVARTNNRVTRRVLEAGKKLRVVGVAGVGTDHVDMAAAHELHIPVLNTPAAASDAVAEFTVELMLQLLRPIPRLAEEYHRGRYREARQSPHGRELRELTIGIVGMGRIGSRVGRICSAGFGARVIYNDIIDVGPFAYPAEPVDKPALWRRSDIVTLHVPLTAETHDLLDERVLSALRPTTLLINAARGAVVNTAALTAALQAGRLGGAALDVTDPEPLPPTHPLFALPHCIVTPHVASRTYAGFARMCAIVDDVLEFLQSGETD